MSGVFTEKVTKPVVLAAELDVVAIAGLAELRGIGALIGHEAAEIVGLHGKVVNLQRVVVVWFRQKMIPALVAVHAGVNFLSVDDLGV